MEISVILNSLFLSKEIFQRSDKLRIKGYQAKVGVGLLGGRGNMWSLGSMKEQDMLEGREVSWLTVCEWRGWGTLSLRMRWGQNRPTGLCGSFQTEGSNVEEW